ncbi:MAG: DUF72 domain-containing protein [Acidobacteriaceae bacterium]|nr:DUF72 domain-containing protein [Acidobacteriaceae bacterium]
MLEAKLYCGTSGFAYDSWQPDFYPDKLPKARFLSYYATRLNAVEVNYTYRRLAAPATFDKWIAATPNGFLFLPKAHMNITHRFKLEGAEEFTRLFLDTLYPFERAGRLGPILFQLPPNLPSDAPKLAKFVAVLPRSVKTAFEFRNATWFNERVYEILQSANVALCVAENENLETPHVLTADFVYLRLRKPDYTESELGSIARRIDHYRTNGYPTYAIFKHEESPAGALHAERLLKELREKANA